MKKLSVVILSKNEQKNIKDCIQSVLFADEIIVIDNYSTDKTVSIAQEYKAIVYTRKFDDFASQRNFGLSKATGEWVLFLDADERVSEKLSSEIASVVQ